VPHPKPFRRIRPAPPAYFGLLGRFLRRFAFACFSVSPAIRLNELAEASSHFARVSSFASRFASFRSRLRVFLLRRKADAMRIPPIPRTPVYAALSNPRSYSCHSASLGWLAISASLPRQDTLKQCHLEKRPYFDQMQKNPTFSENEKMGHPHPNSSRLVKLVPPANRANNLRQIFPNRSCHWVADPFKPQCSQNTASGGSRVVNILFLLRFSSNSRLGWGTFNESR
jgi:hypothetical protein